MPRPLNIELGGTGTNDGSTLRGGAYIVPAQFGAVGDGVTDDTAALQAAATAAANKTLILVGSYLVTGQITLSSNTAVIGEPGSYVQTTSPNANIFYATGKRGIKFVGVVLKSTVQGTNVENGGIYLDSCNHCSIVDCEFEGMQQSAVFLNSTSYCTVSRNYVHDSLGMSVGGVDTADVFVYRDSTYNNIEGNFCFGGLSIAFGIGIQGPGTTNPFGNKICNNYIADHSAYGILAYQITAADVRTYVVGNTVQNITGGYNPASGMGIYIQTSGGTIVQGNYVRNCMSSTSSATNGAGAITIAFNGAARETSIVSGNHIDAPKWRGIHISDSSCEVICSDNYVSFADGTAGAGIYVVDSSYTNIANNRVKAANTVARPGISIFASTVDCVGNSIVGNAVTGTNDSLIQQVYSSTFRHKKSRIVGNTCVSTGSSAQAMVIQGTSDSVISDNTLEAPSVCLSVDTVVNCRGTGNVVVQVTTNGFLSGGTCSNTFFDASNYWGSSTTLIQNTAAGVNIVWRATVVPASGNWQRGDEWVLTTPSASTSPGSYCVTAGSPGTWKARANLAA